MSTEPIVARSYAELVRLFRIRRGPCERGRVVLVATAARGAQTLAALSELAMAGAYVSARGDERAALPLSMRVGLVVARRDWSGDIWLAAAATPLRRRGWLLECEARDERGRSLSVAFASISRDENATEEARARSQKNWCAMLEGLKKTAKER